MRQAAADLNFEQAAELRDKMIELKKNLADAEKYLTSTQNSRRCLEFCHGRSIEDKMWVRPLFSLAFLPQICYTHAR